MGIDSNLLEALPFGLCFYGSTSWIGFVCHCHVLVFGRDAKLFVQKEAEDKVASRRMAPVQRLEFSLTLSCTKLSLAQVNPAF